MIKMILLVAMNIAMSMIVADKLPQDLRIPVAIEISAATICWTLILLFCEG